MNLHNSLVAISAATFVLVGGMPAAEDPARGKSEQVLKALDGPANLEFIETPFLDVTRYIGDVHRIPLDVDWEKLAKVGWDEKTRVTARLQDFTLREALERILGDDLRFDATDKALLITIRSPEEIAQAATQEGKEAKIRRALDQAMHLKFSEAPLKFVVRSLSRHHGINVALDADELAKEGWSERTPITFNYEKGVKLRMALDKILGEKLAYKISDGKLLITSRAAAK
jgi:hypothetical protein